MQATTVKETLKFFIQLFKTSLLGNKAYLEDQRMVESGMLTKAWVLQTLNTLWRSILALSGSSSWQKAYSEYTDDPLVDIEFVEKSQGVVTTILICMIILGIFLDIIVWRRRHLAFMMLYYELSMIIIMSLVPYN